MAVGVIFALLMTLLRFTLYNYKNGNFEVKLKKDIAEKEMAKKDEQTKDTSNPKKEGGAN